MNWGIPLFSLNRIEVREFENKQKGPQKEKHWNKSAKRNFYQCFALKSSNLQFINSTWKKKKKKSNNFQVPQQSCNKNQKKKSKLLLRSTRIRICWNLSLLRYIAVSGRWGYHKRQLHQNMDLAQLIGLNKIKCTQTKS